MKKEKPCDKFYESYSDINVISSKKFLESNCKEEVLILLILTNGLQILMKAMKFSMIVVT